MYKIDSAHEEFWIRSFSLLGFFLVWQGIAMYLQTQLLPSPIQVFNNLYHHLILGELLSDLRITLIRVGISFLIAMSIGICIGMLMGHRKKIDAMLDGILILGLNIPALVTIILCYIWFGLTETAAITAVALNKIPTVVVTLREGARAVDKKLLQIGQVYQLSYFKILTKVYLPQLYPYIMAAARNGLALIWKIVLVVELLGRSNGIGFQLNIFFQFFDITSILAYTLAFAMVILMIEALFMRPMERALMRWRE